MFTQALWLYEARVVRLELDQSGLKPEASKYILQLITYTIPFWLYTAVKYQCQQSTIWLVGQHY